VIANIRPAVLGLVIGGFFRIVGQRRSQRTPVLGARHSPPVVTLIVIAVFAIAGGCSPQRTGVGTLTTDVLLKSWRVP
jgi:hypothetical protein